MTNGELIQRILSQLEMVSEAHGVLKCRLIAEIADELASLKRGLEEENGGN